MQNITPTYEIREKFKADAKEKLTNFEIGLLGRSILGKDIDYYKIGEGRSHIVVAGAHHGMEYITTLALYDFMEFLDDKFTRRAAHCDIDICFLLQRFTFWIVPCLNPDGVELCISGAEKNPLCERQIRMNGGSDFSSWQANARGVDLNHNYDYGFFEYKRIEAECGISAGRTKFSGEYPESEPETHSLANLIRTLFPSLIISLHSQGNEFFSMPKTEYMERLSRKIAAKTGYEYSLPSGGAAYGGLSDFCGGVLGIPSFTLELGEGENPLPLSSLPAICERLRAFLVLLPTYL